VHPKSDSHDDMNEVGMSHGTGHMFVKPLCLAESPFIIAANHNAVRRDLIMIAECLESY